MGEEERPNKIRKVSQNHEVTVTHINYSNMDHFCTVQIRPDHMNPEGVTKRGIRLNAGEFSKGAKILGERCGYRLLTPLSSFRYAGYLNRATEDFMKNGNGGDGLGTRQVLQCYNQSPFRYKQQFYVACQTSAALRVFELNAKKDNESGFATEIHEDNLPFLINWTGPNVLDMEVDDKKCQLAMIKMIKAIEELQPNIEGLGLCVLSEIGRFLSYNALADGEDCNMEKEDDEGGMEAEEFSGFKQMLLLFQSSEVETGKSFLADIVLRIFHGTKTGKHSTLSFESAKALLGRGEPVVIDDFNNDDIGMVLLSRGSKAIWGQAKITLRNSTITPKANLLICTNEDITSLRVEGKNKEEVFRKLSIVDLGEEPMKSNTEKKGEMFKVVIEQTKIIRKNLPSFYGLILQTNIEYIGSEDFKKFEQITKHERLANILQNVENLQEKLKKFSDDEVEANETPKSLLSQLDTSCLTNKSELVLKLKSPDKILELLMCNGANIIMTEHDKKPGLAFDFSSLTKYPWFEPSFSVKQNGSKVLPKMRTRQLSSDKLDQRAAFVSLEVLKAATISKINGYIKERVLETEVNPIDMLQKSLKEESKEFYRRKFARFQLVEQFLLEEVKKKDSAKEAGFKCNNCDFRARSKGGLTRHKNNNKC